ncbi:MAG: UDP-N-acetylmuramoyl-L-alanyl-D-glutamate--2,6-diaminopimelate ligase [Pseudomonadota bacterium]
MGAALLLRDVLDGFTVAASAGELDATLALPVTGITDDSRAVAPGDVFVAVTGQAADGHRYAAAALEAGAVAVLAERAVAEAAGPVLLVDDLKAARSTLAGRVFGAPSQRLTSVGVTGTNGKTSIACFVAELSERLGEAAGYLGTIGWGRLGALASSALTTESAINVQRRLAALADSGCAWAVLEVSSHALDQRRVDGVSFDFAVFSNLSRDHLDYHGTFEAYGKAKARLFHFPELRGAVINGDDPFGRRLAEELQGSVPVFLYGSGPEADVRWSDLEFHNAGVRGTLTTPWGAGPFEVPLFGDFSVANAVAALAVLCAAGKPFSAVCEALGTLTAVPGRMEFFPGQRTLLVDYAHTPDALEKMLRALTPHRRGRILCVCGCGGDRDRGKRPEMAAAACAHADAVWLTSDNPRSEDPRAIIEDMLAGVPAGAVVEIEVDRLAAIEGAFAAARPEDLVVIAGKGHEDYQEIAGERLPFSDRQVAADLAAGRRPRLVNVEESV